MRKALIILSGLALSACAEAPESNVSRDVSGAFASQNAISPAALRAQTGAEQALAEQAQSLVQMTTRLERRAAGKGAAIGTSVGCALVLVDASRAQSCLASAAIGAAVGAAQGKRAVAKRAETLSGNDLAKALRPTNKTMQGFQADLPGVLAAQDAELTALAAANDPRYDTRRAEISAQRKALSDALSQTEQQARAAARTIKAASEQGQSGLGYHWMASEKLADQAVSARASIDLLS